MTPLVTIYIPTKNRPHLLKRAVRSCLVQNYTNFEIIIIDDNSDAEHLSSITEKINKGEGSLGALINDKKTVDNLNKTMQSIDAFVVDLKRNPKNYLSPLGRSSKKIMKAASDTTGAK